MEDKEVYNLNDEVAKSYSYAPDAPPVFESLVHGFIDIRTVSLEKVKALVKDGCDYFIALEPSKTKAAAPAAN